ncbi:MAG: SDR family NAD(P)-dependent oxidoreductase [Sneathiellales bacterium]|nr:SDR family NAD(P)-dependent oxidoreductase [Sneathiellales bacterium]
MKTAVISGACGGLGQALTAQLKARGFQIYGLDIDISDAEQSDQFCPLQCDITDQASLEAAVATILKETPEIDLVIYNAGITQIAPFDQVSNESHRKVFDINYFGAAAMASLFLKPVRHAKGTHIAISSVAGFAPLYHRTTYAASKHALEGLFKSLRSEEMQHQVKVLIASPSFVATNLGNSQRQKDGTARPGSATDGKDYMSAEDAAKAILKGYDNATPMIPVGRIAKLAWRINRFAPNLYQKLMEREIKGTGP